MLGIAVCEAIIKQKTTYVLLINLVTAKAGTCAPEWRITNYPDLNKPQ